MGEDGTWGPAVEYVMSRKTYLWFQFALHMFPSAPYLVKGDDDMFMRVPQYLADLRVMPQQGLYMGRMIKPLNLFWKSRDIVFAAGSCYTLSKDVAQALVSYKPLAALVSKSYSIWRTIQYKTMSADNEDRMVGRVLQEKLKLEGLITVDMGSCKFEDFGGRGQFPAVTPKWVVVHHVREEDYRRLWKWFEDHGAPPAPSQLYWFSKTSAALVC
uniref:Hexosyltransferase n=1 Tax=Trypanosoma congolense (strain IL3000) TaxID=1068625 RepID=G0UIP3_TRYCI|nr:unnamed protein product [Trypanosoma congolense IL3000]